MGGLRPECQLRSRRQRGHTADQARRTVERALGKVVGQILSDPAFMAAMTTQLRTS
jgi:hypothetical protein